MRINRRRASLSKKIKLTFDVNIFSALTTGHVKKAIAAVEREIKRGYSVTIAAYDWRLALTLKRHYPVIKANLLLPDLIFDPINTRPTSAFYCRYKKSYLFYQSFYGRDCAWFFTFNPKKYFIDLGALLNATGADRIEVTRSCRSYVNNKTTEGSFFYNYAQYSQLSQEGRYPTWNHKFKSHLVSLADYYQLEKHVKQPEAHQYLSAVRKAALLAEEMANNNHREGIKAFYDGLKKIGKTPNISTFKDLWLHPVALNKISDIYAAMGDIENYLTCKKIELNHLLGIHSNNPVMLSERQLLDAMFKHITMEADGFKFRNYHDEEFFKLVSGKSVAIVGPAPNQEQHGQTIDSFDNVIRLRFPEKDTDSIPFVGKKTTIINNSLAFSNLMKDSLIYDDKISVTYQSAIPIDNKAKRARTLFELENNLLTMPHTIPRILIDLLAFSPNKIKVFNTTLFLAINGKTYTKNYDEKISEIFQKHLISSKRNVCLNFLYHDPTVNFLITKSLYERYFFEADQQLSNILKMNIKEYIHQRINSH
ncbi:MULTISPECIES: hypothetical protein [unclassified Halomonas]|uniref:hypothetical protein n=1 Tax=unclassified Halomonas TaxID=2609666 RepID=UPI0007D9048A|nr:MULTISPECIES: hypothetical protein [unclassified Halomonas]MBT2786001.1 hypothetical protein [Halomonas sp. ISL-106]MBT2797023.1 hypothetical protein [Halomonas sp. ISL-104]OAL58410.1 hypothetical protein A6R74_05820 [Halomonas sp. ALS9]